MRSTAGCSHAEPISRFDVAETRTLQFDCRRRAEDLLRQMQPLVGPLRRRLSIASGEAGRDPLQYDRRDDEHQAHEGARTEQDQEQRHERDNTRRSDQEAIESLRGVADPIGVAVDERQHPRVRVGEPRVIAELLRLPKGCRVSPARASH